MAFWVLLAIGAGLSIVSSLLRDLSKTTPKAAPGEVPDVTPGDPVPLVFGTCKVPCRVVEFDGWRAEAHHTGARPYLWGAVGPKPVVGYWYRVKMTTVVCLGPVDALVDLQFNGKSLRDLPAQKTRTGTTEVVVYGASLPKRVSVPTYTTAPAAVFEPFTSAGAASMASGLVSVPLNAPSLFGGNDHKQAGGAGGGVQGTVHWRNGAGHATQVPAVVAARGDGAQTPDWRHYAYLAWDDVQIGMSPNLPPLHAVVRRTPPGQGTWFDDADSIGDANPAAILLELLLSPTAGVGLAADALDFDSFRTAERACAAANALAHQDPSYDPDLSVGLSFVVDQRTAAARVIADVLRVIDGALYTDPQTGKLCLTLFRSPADRYYGYDPAALRVIDPSVAHTCRWSAPTPAARVSTARVQYTDRTRNFAANTVTATNDALVAALGGDLVQEVELLGVSGEALARRLAQRELRALTTPLGRAELRCTRAPAGLVPGSLFRLVWPEYGVNARMRVVDIDGGPLDDPVVTIVAVQDVYGTPGYLATRVVTTPWADPSPVGGVARPVVEEELSQSATTGYLGLVVEDPQERVTQVEANAQSGYVMAGGYQTLAGPPYLATVPLADRATSRIAWRVTYTEAGGQAETLEGVATFDPAPTLPAPVLSAQWLATGVLRVTAVPQAGAVPVAGVRLAADTAPIADVATGALETTAPFAIDVPDLTPGTTVYAAARSEGEIPGAAGEAASPLVSSVTHLTFVVPTTPPPTGPPPAGIPSAWPGAPGVPVTAVTGTFYTHQATLTGNSGARVVAGQTGTIRADHYAVACVPGHPLTVVVWHPGFAPQVTMVRTDGWPVTGLLQCGAPNTWATYTPAAGETTLLLELNGANPSVYGAYELAVYGGVRAPLVPLTHYPGRPEIPVGAVQLVMGTTAQGGDILAQPGEATEAHPAVRGRATVHLEPVTSGGVPSVHRPGTKRGAAYVAFCAKGGASVSVTLPVPASLTYPGNFFVVQLLDAAGHLLQVGFLGVTGGGENFVEFTAPATGQYLAEFSIYPDIDTNAEGGVLAPSVGILVQGALIDPATLTEGETPVA